MISMPLVSCGPGHHVQQSLVHESEDLVPMETEFLLTESFLEHEYASESASPTSAQTPATSKKSVTICSSLSFKDVQWPNKLTLTGRKALALALNVTGSFEGHQGWATIANNFDGQGMSLGLLQQNFGQGTLQPLLLAMRKYYPSTFRSAFTTRDLNSLNTMLSRWESYNPIRSVASVNSYNEVELSEPLLERETELFPDIDTLSDMDEGEKPTYANLAASSYSNRESVYWAKSSLYLSNGKTFKTNWRRSFQSLALSAPYRSYQIQSAISMFDRARGYFSTFGFKEMRSFLLMYDFVVQNGGFNASHRNQFLTYLRKNPRASETTKLRKLLDIRIKSVRWQYRSDVRDRKNAIINSQGTVHKTYRRLSREYCYDPYERIR